MGCAIRKATKRWFGCDSDELIRRINAPVAAGEHPIDSLNDYVKALKALQAGEAAKDVVRKALHKHARAVIMYSRDDYPGEAA